MLKLTFLLRKKLTTFDLLLLSLPKRSDWFVLCFLYFVYVSIRTIAVINIIYLSTKLLLRLQTFIFECSYSSYMAHRRQGHDVCTGKGVMSD